MKISAVLMCLVLVGGVAVAQNTGGDGGDAGAQGTSGTVFWPYFNSAADLNAYLSIGLTDGQSTRATDD